MRSYRFARRSFLAGLGGAFGLEIMLRNLEAAAQGAKSPARMMFMHFPIGTMKNAYLPTGGQTDFTFSPMLKPFEALRSDTIVLYGFADNLSCPGGGGHEAGTPFTTTCASAPGTRANGGEGDDGVAGGPSFDQIFLKRITGLKQPGKGYMSTLCDARVDSLETSTQTLCYDYATRSIKAANPAGANITEYTPLAPELVPANSYTTMFQGFVPGSGTGTGTGTASAMLNNLRGRKSVLDYCLRELKRLRDLSPGDQRPKIDSHTAAIQDMEAAVVKQISDASSAGGAGGSGGGGGGVACTVPAAPAASLKGQKGSAFNYGEGNEDTSTSDEAIHEQVGNAHAAIILAAFQCDLVRVATFQWSPGTNHVSFKGLYPATPEGSFMHHPMSHRQGAQSFFNGPVMTGTDKNASLYQFLVGCQTWYNTKTAAILQNFKNAKDAFGNSILDYTVVPFLTEVGDPSHARGPKASMIFGGKALGMKGGQFLNFESRSRPQVDVWLTVAQALANNATPLNLLPAAEEKFNRSGAAVINGLWAAPA